MNSENVNLFSKLDIRVGKIIKAEIFEQAIKPAYILTIDFGEDIGLKKTSAQITNYELKSLINKKCICLLYTSPSPRDVEESRMPSSA